MGDGVAKYDPLSCGGVAKTEAYIYIAFTSSTPLRPGDRIFLLNHPVHDAIFCEIINIDQLF
jgi:hypothetical protein